MTFTKYVTIYIRLLSNFQTFKTLGYDVVCRDVQKYSLQHDRSAIVKECLVTFSKQVCSIIDKIIFTFVHTKHKSLFLGVNTEGFFLCQDIQMCARGAAAPVTMGRRPPWACAWLALIARILGALTMPANNVDSHSSHQLPHCFTDNSLNYV